MKMLLCIFLCLFVVGCASTSNHYQYCAISDIEDPEWVKADRNNGYLVAKVGVMHSREAERDIVSLTKRALAGNIYSDVHVYYKSTFDGEKLASDHNINMATNVHLKNVKSEYRKVDNCLVSWASVSFEQANISQQKAHPINKQEHKAWQRINESRGIGDYREHLQKFPQGLYTQTAKARIDVLEQQQTRRAIGQAKAPPGLKVLLHLVNWALN